MKTFAASLVILAVLLICSVVNCVYIDRISNKLLELEKCFPTKEEEGKLPPSDIIAEAQNLWESSMDRLLAAAKANYIYTITTSLNNVCDFYENGSPADYVAARSQLKEAIKMLKASDSLKFSSII